jgi:hypothetical protein
MLRWDTGLVHICQLRLLAPAVPARIRCKQRLYSRWWRSSQLQSGGDRQLLVQCAATRVRESIVAIVARWPISRRCPAWIWNFGVFRRLGYGHLLSHSRSHGASRAAERGPRGRVVALRYSWLAKNSPSLNATACKWHSDLGFTQSLGVRGEVSEVQERAGHFATQLFDALQGGAWERAASLFDLTELAAFQRFQLEEFLGRFRDVTKEGGELARYIADPFLLPPQIAARPVIGWPALGTVQRLVELSPTLFFARYLEVGRKPSVTLPCLGAWLPSRLKGPTCFMSFTAEI